jgi:hypothetical protein
MKTFIKVAVFVLIAIAIGKAQPTVYELACPNGYSPLPTLGKSYDQTTGQWRANICISDTGNGRQICQMDGCGNGSGFPAAIDLTASLPLVFTPSPIVNTGAASINTCGGDAGSGGTRGVVPAPAAGDTAANKILAADCTWHTPLSLGIVAQVQSDWGQTNTALPSFIQNKPTIPAAQVQSDWAETNAALPDFILNKPQYRHAISFTIGDPAGSALTAGATTTTYITIPFACTISSYSLVLQPSGGTITVAFWKANAAAPTSANSISTAGLNISTGTAIESTTLTDFTTTAVAVSDILAMNVSAASVTKFINGVLTCDGP